MTRTITSNAPGSGSSISSSWKASLGSPSRSARITHAAIVRGSSPGATSSFETSDTSTATLHLSGSDRDGNRGHPSDAGPFGSRSVSFPSESTTTFEGPMEASEKPQLPLDAPDGGGVVRALDDRLVIERLTVADDRAARVVRERAESGRAPADTVVKAIEIGTRVLDSEETAANVDYVRHELEAGLGRLRSQLGDTLEDGAKTIGEQIAAVFGAERTDSVQAQIRDIVVARSQEQMEALMRSLTAEDSSNPLVAVQAQLGSVREEMTRLVEREAGDARVAAAEAAGTRKGFSFEERVHEALEGIASARGDVAVHTGGETAEGGGKKGDTLVEIGACGGPAQGRIVFEAKDKRLSKNDAWAELNEGMATRAAAFAVLVVAGEEKVPAGREQLHEYEGNKLIVAVDRDEPRGLPLEVAYRLAAARVAMARDRELTVDAVAVRDAAQEAVSTLKQAQAIRSTLTGIKTSSDKARAGLDAMVAAVQARLDRIDSLVAEAES